MLIVFRGPANSSSGYGAHCRMILRIMYDIFPSNKHTVVLQATPWGNTPFILREYPEKHIIDEYLSNFSKVDLKKDKPDLSVQLILPNEWDSELAKKNIGITAAVETDRLNPKWVDCCNDMDLVLVPSTHIKKSFENSGILETPLKVLHETYDERIYNDELSYNLDLPEIDTDFNFLFVGQFAGKNEQQDRKNVMRMMKIFIDTFKDREDVGLIMKINAGGHSKIDREICKDRISNFVKANREGKYPKIYIIHGPMDNDEIAQLYIHPKVKCFLLMTRAEGFGIPVLEAAVSGLPVAATNWSGHLDILNVCEKSFTPLDYFMSPLKFADGNIFIENAYWAEIDQENAERRLKKLVDSYNWAEQGANRLKPIVREKFSHETIKKRFYDLLKEHVL